MKGDRSTFIAAAIGIAAILCLGAVSLKVGDRPRRMGPGKRIFREKSRDHGVDQAQRELKHIYEGLIKFANRTQRLPAGDPLNLSSEFRREIPLTEDDVRAPSEWGLDLAYAARYLELRGDGTPKPAFPPKGVRDVWMSCEVPGDQPSVVLLWSDGKTEVRPSKTRLAVRPRNSRQFGPFAAIFVYPDEPGAPLVFRTLEQRDEFRASQMPPQFRVLPFEPPPPMVMRGHIVMVSTGGQTTLISSRP